MTHKYDLSCKEMLGNLSDFIDGDLSDDACQEIQRHMAGCENCRVVYDTLTRTIYLYQASAAEGELPEDVRGRLYQCLRLDDLLNTKK